MIYLIIVSIIWALSFSLIKGNLVGVDSNFVVFVRLLISFIIFVPFLKLKNIPKNILVHFFIIGVIQYGLMYSAYIYSYQFLKAYEIAIMTILTPIFVVLISDLFAKKISPLHWLTAVLTILGSAIILFSENMYLGFWKGILLIQFSNLCFAFGQVYFVKIIKGNIDVKPLNIFGILYFGALLYAGVLTSLTTDFNALFITDKQWFTLIYLGAIASGIGFFLWNFGATKVSTGTLAILNNLKIPLGVLFAFLFLNETINFLQLVIGVLFIGAALLIENKYFHMKSIS